MKFASLKWKSINRRNEKNTSELGHDVSHVTSAVFLANMSFSFD